MKGGRGPDLIMLGHGRALNAAMKKDGRRGCLSALAPAATTTSPATAASTASAASAAVERVNAAALPRPAAVAGIPGAGGTVFCYQQAGYQRGGIDRIDALAQKRAPALSDFLGRVFGYFAAMVVVLGGHGYFLVGHWFTRVWFGSVVEKR